MLEAQLSDIEFYLLKISRLQSDLAGTQEELMSARLRLRTAEDYQIKYQLLLKQSQQQNSRMRFDEREQEKKIAQLIAGKIQDRDSYWGDRLVKLQKQLHEKYGKQVEKITEEFTSYRRRHEKQGAKVEQQEILVYKNKKLQKENQLLEQKLRELKKQHQKSYEKQLNTMRGQLEQKNKQKQNTQRTIYRQKIDKLEKNIVHLQQNLEEMKKMIDPNREKQIQRLENQLHSTINQNNQQIRNINKKFAQKYAQLQQLLADKQQRLEQFRNEKKQLRTAIKTIQDNLFNKQRQHEIELFHLKQHMSKIREDEIEDLKKQLGKIQQNIDKQKNMWVIGNQQKNDQLLKIKNKHEQQIQRYKDQKQKLLKKISQLKDRLREFQGQREAGQTQLLLKSLKDIENKEKDFNNYENGITFLDRQLKKSLAKVEQKNIEITKLVQQLNEFRKDSQIEIEELREKLRKEKVYYTDKIHQLQQQIRQSNEVVRTRQREHKARQKQIQNKSLAIQKQNTNLKNLQEQLQKDYNRLHQNKKAIQLSYRQEREKVMTSKSDLSIAKKQKWLQLEKQKNQFYVIFKQKQQQIKNKYQVQMERLRAQRNQLKKQNQLLKGLIQADKKDENGQNKQNKQGFYSEYYKKMSTLNLQIALTKNIYDLVVQAKSKKNKQGKKISDCEIIEEAESQVESIEEQQRVFKTPQIIVHEPDLLMSFNPNKK